MEDEILRKNSGIELQENIIKYFREHREPLNYKELVDKTGANPKNVEEVMRKMVSEKMLLRYNGRRFQLNPTYNSKR